MDEYPDETRAATKSGLANPPVGPRASTTPLIELDRATVCRDLRPALVDLTLRIELGRHTAILGPNGCGKSTFVKLIHREVYAVARAGVTPVRVLGEARWDVFALRGRLGLVAPDLQRDLLAAPDLRALDAVITGCFASQRVPDEFDPALRERALAALADADAGHLAERTLASLSTGEARRVLIARALVHRPRALLLDEPTSGLDLAARERFLAMLRTLAQGGTSLVLVTHHVEEIIDQIERVILLCEGRVVGDGTPAQMLTSQRLSALYGVPVQVERGENGYRAFATPNIPFSA